LETKLTSPREFLAYVTPKFTKFVLHNHVAKWQDIAYKVSIEKLKVGEILSLIDFVKNYSFKEQNEVKKQHWYNFQMTILYLVHITYKINLDHNQNEPKSCHLIT
jgi:hypothetical protein